MNRREYLEIAAQTICHDRQDVHGSPEQCFGVIADYWNVFLSHRLGVDVALLPADVAVLMTLFKTARWQMNPRHADNIVDNIGYAALAGELMDSTKSLGGSLNE